MTHRSWEEKQQARATGKCIECKARPFDPPGLRCTGCIKLAHERTKERSKGGWCASCFENGHASSVCPTKPMSPADLVEFRKYH